MSCSDLFEVSASPMPAPSRVGLPGHVAPVEGEALLSWVAAISAVLGMTPRVFCRDALHIDVRQNPGWWRQPSSATMERIGSLTGLDLDRLAGMTLEGWAVVPGDDDPDRFAAKRWTASAEGRKRLARMDVCALCLAGARRPHLRLEWTFGWTGACPRHGTVLTSRCPSCRTRLRLRGLNGSEPIDLRCGRCNATLSDAQSIPAHPAVLDVQAALIAGKHSGTVILPGIGALDWPTAMALVDVLLSMVWTRRPKNKRDHLTPQQRDRLFVAIGSDMGMAVGAWARIPWKENYGGLLLLAWLFGDLDRRLPRAIATLRTPRLEGLLAPFTDLDELTRDRLRAILSAARTRSPQGRRAWKPWLDKLVAADLREQAARERYRHRRQRLRALAELRDGASVEAVAALVGVDIKTIYRWLHRGAADGLEAALERPTGKPALTSAQAEALGKWIALDHRHQNRQAVLKRARESLGVEINADAATKLLVRHRKPKRGKRCRLWAPRYGPRRGAGSTHDPAPGS